MADLLAGECIGSVEGDVHKRHRKVRPSSPTLLPFTDVLRLAGHSTSIRRPRNQSPTPGIQCYRRQALRKMGERPRPRDWRQHRVEHLGLDFQGVVGYFW
jgi:hypothetical protein